MCGWVRSDAKVGRDTGNPRGSMLPVRALPGRFSSCGSPPIRNQRSAARSCVCDVRLSRASGVRRIAWRLHGRSGACAGGECASFPWARYAAAASVPAVAGAQLQQVAKWALQEIQAADITDHRGDVREELSGNERMRLGRNHHPRHASPDCTRPASVRSTLHLCAAIGQGRIVTEVLRSRRQLGGDVPLPDGVRGFIEGTVQTPSFNGDALWQQQVALAYPGPVLFDDLR